MFLIRLQYTLYHTLAYFSTTSHNILYFVFVVLNKRFCFILTFVEFNDTIGVVEILPRGTPKRWRLLLSLLKGVLLLSNLNERSGALELFNRTLLSQWLHIQSFLLYSRWLLLSSLLWPISTIRDNKKQPPHYHIRRLFFNQTIWE